MAKVNITQVEYGLSKLNTVNIALMTICEGENNRNLDDVHHTLQVALKEIKGAIQDEME